MIVGRTSTLSSGLVTNARTTPTTVLLFQRKWCPVQEERVGRGEVECVGKTTSTKIKTT